MQFRAASFEDAEWLSELRWRSKGHWGYAREWVLMVEGPVRVPALDAESKHLMFVMEEDGRMIGFYSLIRHDSLLVGLDDFFVDAEFIGKGWGRELWQDAIRRSRGLGHRQMAITADPHAEGFYLRQGAVRVGEIASRTDPQRMLPTLAYQLR